MSVVFTQTETDTSRPCEYCLCQGCGFEKDDPDEKFCAGCGEDCGDRSQ